MFIRFFVTIVLALALPALASTIGVVRSNNAITSTNGVPHTTGTQAAIDQCNTGPLQCCDNVQSASSSGMASLLESGGIFSIAPDILVGLTCSPITAGGIGQGSSCSTQPVCCTNNDFNGIFALGCTPVNIAVRRDPQGALELSETSLKDFIDGSNE